MNNTYVRKATSLDYLFLYESYENHRKQFGQNEKERSYFNDAYISTNHVYIVTRNNKDIGYYTLTDDCRYYCHPMACKMSAIAIAKCLAISAYIKYLSIGSKYFETYSWSPLIFKSLAIIFNIDFSAISLDDSYFSLKLDTLNINSEMFFTKYNISNLNEEFEYDCFF